MVGAWGKKGVKYSMPFRTKSKKMVYLMAAALLVIILFSFTGCGAKQVATVNGEVIKAADFDRRVAETQKYYETQMGIDFSGENGQELLKNLKEMVLDQMVTERVLLQEAQKRGIKVTAEQVQNRVDQDKEMVGGEQAYQDALRDQLMMTEAEYRQELEKQMMMETLYQQVVTGQEVKPEEVAEYYNNNKEMFVEPEKVKASHILLNTEEEAQAVITQLKGGASFEDLAVEKSTDPSAKENKGDLGYFDKESNLVQEFKDAAFKLKAGETTQSPVKTEFGFHVIKVVDKIASKQQTLEEATLEITEQLRSEKENSLFQQFVDNLMAGATIVKEDVAGQDAEAAPEPNS